MNTSWRVLTQADCSSSTRHSASSLTCRQGVQDSLWYSSYAHHKSNLLKNSFINQFSYSDWETTSFEKPTKCKATVLRVKWKVLHINWARTLVDTCGQPGDFATTENDHLGWDLCQWGQSVRIVVQNDIWLPDLVKRQSDFFEATVLWFVPPQLIINPFL